MPAPESFRSKPRAETRDKIGAMVAGKLANMRQGARTDIAPVGAMSDADAAKMLNVGERSVERAKTVQRDGAPELVRAVESANVSVSTAAEIATLPKDERPPHHAVEPFANFAKGSRSVRSPCRPSGRLPRWKSHQLVRYSLDCPPHPRVGNSANWRYSRGGNFPRRRLANPPRTILAKTPFSAVNGTFANIQEPSSSGVGHHRTNWCDVGTRPLAHVRQFRGHHGALAFVEMPPPQVQRNDKTKNRSAGWRARTGEGC